MDPLTLAAGVAAVAGIGGAWRTRRRACRAEAEVASLRRELAAERHAASHDPLTGLPNRRAFFQLGAALVADPARPPIIAVVLDLDEFKQVNDRFGHAAGDQVLITVARRFATCAGGNLVARLGGDEFAGLLISPSIDRCWLNQAARRLAAALAAPIQVPGGSVKVTASVGLAPVHGSAHLADALRRADVEMYRAKTSGQAACVAPVDEDVLPRHSERRPAAHACGFGGEQLTHPATWLGRHPSTRAATERRPLDPTSHAEAGRH